MSLQIVRHCSGYIYTTNTYWKKKDVFLFCFLPTQRKADTQWCIISFRLTRIMVSRKFDGSFKQFLWTAEGRNTYCMTLYAVCNKKNKKQFADNLCSAIVKKNKKIKPACQIKEWVISFYLSICSFFHGQAADYTLDMSPGFVVNWHLRSI